MEVVDAVDLIGCVDSEDEAVEVFAADDTCEAARVIRLTCSSQHLKQPHNVSISVSNMGGARPPKQYEGPMQRCNM